MKFRKKTNLKIGQVILALCLGISVILHGCSKNTNNEILFTTISQIDIKVNGHAKQLSAYNSPYTIAYKNNDDTYSIYIFTSPIQYKIDNGEYAIIDNTIVKSVKEGFAFENKANNVKTYFPKTLSEPFRVEKGVDYMEFKPSWYLYGFSNAKKIIFTNMYGDRVSAVVYERKDMDLVFYSTKSGIKMEIILHVKPDGNEFSFSVNSSAAFYENKQNGYILFKKGDGQIESIIYQPLVQYEDDIGQKLDLTAQLDIARKESNYLVTITIDNGITDIPKTKYPIKLDLSFEMYLNKMPDSTVYSDFNVNNYLCHYAAVGQHPALGEGWHYARLRLNYFMTLKPENVKSAYLFIKPLWNNIDFKDLRAYESGTQWSSTQMLWGSKSSPGAIIAPTITLSDKYLGFPMSNYVKACFGDPKWEKESIGFLIRAEKKNAYCIMATSDNSLYAPFVKIDLEKLPAYFEPKDDINQV